MQVLDSPASPPTGDAHPVPSPISTTPETAAKSPSSLRGVRKGEKPEESVSASEVDKPAEPEGETQRKIVSS